MIAEIAHAIGERYMNYLSQKRIKDQELKDVQYAELWRFIQLKLQEMELKALKHPIGAQPIDLMSFRNMVIQSLFLEIAPSKL